MTRLRVPVNEDDHSTGNSGAGIILIEYGDYQCPHCGHAYPLIKKLLHQFNSGLLFVFRNFPLQEVHPSAMIAALAAEAAAKQNKFWEMHDLIFENQARLSGHDLLDHAQELSLDLHQFGQDWKGRETIAKVENDFESGVRSGVNGTPTFFLNENKLDTYDESYESLEDAVRSLQLSL